MASEPRDELDYDDLPPIALPVKVAGKRYTLHEATGSAAVKYRNALLACTKLGPEGKVSSIVGMANVEPLLVHLCLTDNELTDDNGNNKHVSQVTIGNWPNRIQKALFKKIKAISELDEDEETIESLTKQQTEIAEKIAKIKGEAVKNELDGTTDGST